MLLVFNRDGGGILAVHAHDVQRVERREIADSREGAPRDAKTARVYVRLASDDQEYKLAANVSAEEVVERVNAELGRKG